MKPIKMAASPSNMSIEQAVEAVCSSQTSMLNKMNLSELSAVNTKLMLSNIRTSMTSILPEDADKVAIANHALSILNKLKSHLEARIQELSKPEISLSQSILQPPLCKPENHQDSSQLLTPEPAQDEQQAEYQDTVGATAADISTTAAKIACIHECLSQHLETGKAKELQCSLCQDHFHKLCVGTKTTPRTWICPRCTELPSLVRSLVLRMEIHEKELVELRQENVTLVHLLNEQRGEIQQLCESNIAQHQKSTTRRSEVSTNTMGDRLAFPTQEDVQSVGLPAADDVHLHSSRSRRQNLIIGDSIVRDIHERGLSNTSVKCIRGGKVKDIKDELDSRDIQEYSAVIFHVGTNNCTTEDKYKDGVSQYRELVQGIKSHAPATKLVLSTICPRDDNARSQQRVVRFNKEIRKIAEDHSCEIVDNDVNFIDHDGPNTAYLNSRGLHLSSKGTRTLLRNMNNKLNIIHARPGPRPPQSSNGGGRREPRFRRDSNRELGHHRETTGNCNYCGFSNHTTKDCKYDHPLRCFVCNELGHKANCHHGHQSFKAHNWSRPSFQDSFRYNYGSQKSYGR